MATAEQSPMYSPFFGVMGATSAMVFSGKFNFKIMKVDLEKK